MRHHPIAAEPADRLPAESARLDAVAALAACLPHLSLEQLLDGPDRWQQPPYAPTQIVPGLHQGGTQDQEVLSQPGDDYRRRGSYPFDTVITLYASAQPAPWGVEELRFGFPDAALQGPEADTVVRAARYAHDRWLSGAEVLIRCQAGMNRSGLVTALVLMMAGLTPGQAITRIRQQRGASCLFNEHFVTWLVERANTVTAGPGPQRRVA